MHETSHIAGEGRAYRTKSAAWLLALITVTFLLIGLDRVNEATDANFEDTQPFLQVALFIKDNGGATHFLRLCLSGTYTADLQKPLYPLLLSTFASRELAFFPQARILSLVMGLLVIVAFFYFSRDLYGEDVACIGAASLTLNDTFLRVSSHVQCETTLILFMLGSLYCMMKGLTNERYWIAAGFFCGLAYLTKGTGLLLLPVFAMGSLLAVGLQCLKRSPFWLFFLIFLTVSSPLLARNVIVYGQPTYEGVNNHAIWMDHWEDISLPQYQVLRQYPEVAWEGTALPTMKSYLASHSLSKIRERVITGLSREFRLFLASMGPLAYALVLEKAVFVLFCTGLLLEIRAQRVRYIVLFMVAVFVPFAFMNQSVPAIRFISVLIPIVCLYSAIGIVRTLRFLAETFLQGVSWPTVQPWLVAALGSSFALVGGYALLTQDARWPDPPAPLAEDVAELSNWIETTVLKNDLVLVGGNAPYWVYAWHTGMRGKIAVAAPAHRAFQEGNLQLLNTMLQNPRAGPRRYVIVHKDDLRSLPFLNTYFGYSVQEGLHQLQPIGGWTLVRRHSQHPTAFLVYQAIPS